MTGVEFYTAAYDRLRAALATYGLDDVVVVVDLQNLYWMLQFDGFEAPAAFDASGMRPASTRSWRGSRYSIAATPTRFGRSRITCARTCAARMRRFRSSATPARSSHTRF